AVPAANGDASMIDMRVNAGSAFGVTSCQFVPPFLVTWIMPSSEPTQMTPFVTGDSAMVKIVAKFSAPLFSTVIELPPAITRVRGSCRVRSGEIACQVRPASLLLSSTFPPSYRVLGSCGETMIGVVQLKRYFAVIGGAVGAHTSIMRLEMPLPRSTFSPDAYVTSGCWGSTAMIPDSPPPG